MNIEHSTQLPTQISREKLLAFVSTFIGGSKARPDDEHPLPPGPWDPVIRVALERLPDFGPGPDPWRYLNAARGPSRDAVLAFLARRFPELWEVVGGGPGGPRSWAADELNPQPLPPRRALFVELARAVIERAGLIHEVAGAIGRGGGESSIIIVSGYVSELMDEICGNGFKLKWPFPGPHPHWFAGEVSGVDLVVMAAQFSQAAGEAHSRDLQHSLAEAGGKLAETGFSRM